MTVMSGFGGEITVNQSLGVWPCRGDVIQMNNDTGRGLRCIGGVNLA